MYLCDSGMYTHSIHSTVQFRERSFCPGMLSARSTKKRTMLEALDGHSTWYRKDDTAPAPADKAGTAGMVLAQRDELSGELHLLLNNIMTNPSTCSVLQSRPLDITLEKCRSPECPSDAHTPSQCDLAPTSSCRLSFFLYKKTKNKKPAVRLLSANSEASASTITVLFQAYHSTELMIIL